MTDDLLARARDYAFEKWPPDHEVDDPFGETGVARSDEYGYDETARNAAIQMAEWLLAQLPDREAVVDLLYKRDCFIQYRPEDQADLIWELADAVLALFRGD